jgi:hypothetical protein
MKMAEVPENMRFLIFGKGTKWHATVSVIVNWLGLVCLVLGIVASAINEKLGLGALNWLVLAIALWVWGLAAWLCAYFGAKEG